MAKRRLKDSPLAGALGKVPRKKAPERTSLMVAPEVAERIRDAAHWQRQTLSKLVEEAILEKVERLETARGEVFPPRPK